MKTTMNSLNALELATLSYYADASFDASHSAPAHPALIADLIRRRLLRRSLGSYDTTPAGEAAIAASPLTIKIDDAQIEIRSEGKEFRRYHFEVTVSGHATGPVSYPYVRVADPIFSHEIEGIVAFCKDATRMRTYSA